MTVSASFDMVYEGVSFFGHGLLTCQLNQNTKCSNK